MSGGPTTARTRRWTAEGQVYSSGEGERAALTTKMDGRTTKVIFYMHGHYVGEAEGRELVMEQLAGLWVAHIQPVRWDGGQRGG